jgi:hypothetical protein
MKLYLNNIHISGIVIILVSIAFPSTIHAQPTQENSPATKIEVIYFHAPNRCPSCVANETQTKQVLEKHFKAEIASGQVSFVSLDLKEDKNKALVVKYEIVFPTLLILKKQGSNELKTDYTNTAFDYAFSEPEKYEKLLQAEIQKQLNSN